MTVALKYITEIEYVPYISPLQSITYSSTTSGLNLNNIVFLILKFDNKHIVFVVINTPKRCYNDHVSDIQLFVQLVLEDSGHIAGKKTRCNAGLLEASTHLSSQDSNQRSDETTKCPLLTLIIFYSP